MFYFHLTCIKLKHKSQLLTSLLALKHLAANITYTKADSINHPNKQQTLTIDEADITIAQVTIPAYNPPAPTATQTLIHTQNVYIPVPVPGPASAPVIHPGIPALQGPSPFLHPLAVILILCSILGFISVLITLPFDLPGMSSSSKPSVSSSTSSSSPKPSSSSSSSSKPSSSSSSSSSSKESPKPSAPQPVPTISANAWMSFFLFCCLVLIILQGPLGLTGNSLVPTLPLPFGGVPTIPGGGVGIGGGWGWGMNNGIGNSFGGMPGCVGVVSNYVPWCQQQQQQQQQPQSQIQVQQIVQQQPQVPPSVYGGVVPGVIAQPQPQNQMGGQGQFASPGGGGGWSWYSDQPGSQVVRQQPAYYPAQQAQQRTVQYQRPGLQVQVNQARGGYPIQGGAGGGNVNIQSQHIGSNPPQPPIQALPVTAPPSAITGMANLENAFYPLLVGAIALLVLFDYAS
ncbi:uncharacterized protein IL334_007548 [Kwoniella shivajii]|uniref:Uncharacterized protein n=1 Tax=Kwoniella shivajii TaxID=564305 RepID=A0ABZ1DB38_9TREE|nr:hypothetical protein IL334_007548 [Kwoniella shivajii]